MERILRLKLFKAPFNAFVLFFTCFFVFAKVSIAQISWVGNISTDYFDVNNWSDKTINFANLQSTTLLIGAGNPNNAVHTGGNGTNVNYRANYVNTKSTAVFTINGNLYTWNSDSINGNVTLNSPADFNIRNIAYVGRNGTANLTINGGSMASKNAFYIGSGSIGSSGTATIAGGALYVGTDLNIASTTGTTGQLNLTGGAVYIPGNLNLGASGQVYISGIGLLSLVGNKVAAIENYIAAGKITCPVGKTLSAVYEGGNTIVSIPQNPNSMLTEYPNYVILRNSILEVKIDKGTSNILSLKVNGVETVNTVGSSRTGTYYDFTTSKGFETIFGCSYSVKRDEQDIVDISFKRPYRPGSNVTPCDAEIHYVLKKDDSGIYTYSILEHKAEYPAFDLGSWRQVMWIAPDASNPNNYLCEKIYVDALRHWQMPSLYDFSQASPTGIAEIVKLNTGVRAGKYDGKYQYSLPFWETPYWGHAGDVNHIGSWFVNGSLEYYNEGPPHHDLNAAAGIIHACLNGVHYNDAGMVVNQGEYWTKIYGPYLIYTSLKATGDENWADAKARTAIEKSEWPYSWLTNTPQYPLAPERGSISGRFIIKDSFKPGVTGKNAWVGVTIISNPLNQWQFEEKNYQYWVKTDADGNFTIPNIRPGSNYTFIGYSEGEVGEYIQGGVSVSAGITTSLGDVTWNIARNKGNLVWEIGVPNRKASEFKFGDFAYCEGFIYDQFASTFPALIEYDVATKDWSNQLPYVHSPYLTSSQTLSTWKWRLNFTLPNTIPVTGNATLTIAYAGSDHAQEWIYVNNENTAFVTYYPENGGGNAFLRQANHAKYSYKTILIPMSRLKPGANTITLVMPSSSALANHVMYDYISLEADVSNVLPVDLISFTAKEVKGRVKLSWETASEKNSDRFEIERSADGKSFSFLSAVKGNELSNGGSYQLYDNHPANGKNYYRLKQYDLNGSAYEKGIQVVDIEGLDKKTLLIYPNPNVGEFSVELPVQTRGALSLQISTTTGQVVYLKDLYPSGSILNVNLGFKPVAGEYILMIKGADFSESTKVIFK